MLPAFNTVRFPRPFHTSCPHALARRSQTPHLQVRKLCALGEPGPAPRLVLLDIPDGGAFYAADEGAAADAAGVRAFLAAYAAKTLARQQLSRG